MKSKIYSNRGGPEQFEECGGRGWGSYHGRCYSVTLSCDCFSASRCSEVYFTLPPMSFPGPTRVHGFLPSSSAQLEFVVGGLFPCVYRHVSYPFLSRVTEGGLAAFRPYSDLRLCVRALLLSAGLLGYSNRVGSYPYALLFPSWVVAHHGTVSHPS